MKKIFAYLFSLGMLLVCCSCTLNNNNSVQFSDKYLAGFSSGGGYGNYNFWNNLPTEYRICYDGTVEVYMPVVENMEMKDYSLAGSYQLTDEETQSLLKIINQKKLYKLDPKLDKDACDAESKYIILYDENDEELKNCGGYCPTNKDFNEMYKAIKDNFHLEEHKSIREAWIEKQKEANGQ